MTMTGVLTMHGWFVVSWDTTRKSLSRALNRLVDCPANLFGHEDCSHGEDAGVSCDTRSGRFEGHSI